MCRRLLAVAVGVALLGAPSLGAAQDAADVPLTVGPGLAPGGVLDDFQPYWSAGRPRWFAAATFEGGAV